MGKYLTVYKNEIRLAEKYPEVACTLDQLRKKDLVVSDLYKTVHECLGKKTSKTSFEKSLKKMVSEGMVMEIFSNDKKFIFRLSQIGKDIYSEIKNSNEHLTTAHS